MEKAIEIKRRAQRCIQNGDLDGALNEYEKLVGSEDSDPYNYVLLADLLYKKGDQVAASDRYLSAVGAYERASLFKNAIAVCKKMLRLSLSPAKVLQSLGNLHALDGLSGEAALYYVQYAEHMVRSSSPVDAANALRQAFDVCQDNIRVLEQLSEAWLLAGENGHASQVLVEAACHYRDRGSEADAQRCLDRAAHLDPTLGAGTHAEPAGDGSTFAMAPVPHVNGDGEPRSMLQPDHRELEFALDGNDPPVRAEAQSPAPPLDLERMHGLDNGRHEVTRPLDAATLGQEDVAHPHATAAHGSAGDAAEAGEYDGDEPEQVEYVIDDDEETPDAADSLQVTGVEPADGTATGPGEDDPAGGAESEAVYEIAADEVIPYDTPSAEAADDTDDDTGGDDEPVYEIADDSLATPEEPGLSFQPAEAHEPVPTPEEIALAAVEELLTHAQSQFRSGDRDEASHTLTQAAQAYEAYGRLENAATIYRSLGRGAHATPEILELWLGNCERRSDTREAAAVACDLGDRALNDGDEQVAQGWFERAISLDGDNDTARRRLERLAQANAAARVATEQATPEEPGVEAAAPAQRVEIAVGRAEAVSFDLAGLLAEFQRGVDAQLAGDAQSHYDLAMTYREMGLLDQAMESFRNAGQDARFAARAAEMHARCLADQGRHSEATGEFARALALPGVTEENDIELRYHFANSLVELGRLEEALPEYEQVLERMPDFEDVGARLDALRRTLSQA